MGRRRMIELIEHVPRPLKYVADGATWGAVLIGWLGIIQPVLTVIATVLAIWWTGVQLYGWYKKK